MLVALLAASWPVDPRRQVEPRLSRRAGALLSGAEERRSSRGALGEHKLVISLVQLSSAKESTLVIKLLPYLLPAIACIGLARALRKASFQACFRPSAGSMGMLRS